MAVRLQIDPNALAETPPDLLQAIIDEVVRQADEEEKAELQAKLASRTGR